MEETSSELVKDKVFSWLREEGISANIKHADKNEWVISAHPPGVMEALIAHNEESKDRLEITLRILLKPETQEKLRALSQPERHSFYYDLVSSLISNQVQYLMEPEPIPSSITIIRNLWYDGLTKDHFMTALQRVLDVGTLVLWRLKTAFGTGYSK